MGRLTTDFEIEWSARDGRSFPGADEGVSPSVRFVDRASNLVREVHRSAGSGNRWYWNGSLRAAGGSIAWTRGADGGQTQDPLFNKARDVVGRRSIAVKTGSHGAFGSDTLLYTTGSSGWQRIRYQQIAFVEAQRGDGHAFATEGAWFFAATAKDSSARAWAQGWRLGGKLVRLWQFNDPHFATDPPPSFPATDHPFSDWYKQYCAAVGSVS